MASNGDNKLSFFVKIFSENEEISEELNSLEFGHAVYFISDKEMLSVNKDYSVAVEEELEVDEIKVNESCPVCD